MARNDQDWSGMIRFGQEFSGLVRKLVGKLVRYDEDWLEMILKL